MTNYYEGVSPTGRLVAGNPFSPTTKGHGGKEVAPHYFIQVAFPKMSPQLPELWANQTAAAREYFSEDVLSRPDFSWKRADGDDIKYTDREGWKGCWIITFKTGGDYPPRGIYGMKNEQLLSPSDIKRGYQVKVAYSVRPNNNNDKPGVFMNFSMVKLIALDKEIVVGPQASTVFGETLDANPLQPQAAPHPGQSGQPGQPVAASYPGQPVAASYPGVVPDSTFLTPGNPNTIEYDIPL